MPAGFNLAWQRVVVGFAAFGVGGDAARRVSSDLVQVGFRGGIWKGLEAQFGRAIRRWRLIGCSRRGEVEELPQGLQRLVLRLHFRLLLWRPSVVPVPLTISVAVSVPLTLSVPLHVPFALAVSVAVSTAVMRRGFDRSL